MTRDAEQKLAIFGGPPALSEELHVGKPNLGDLQRFYDRIDDAFERNWLTNHGPMVEELETRLADLTDTRHCVAMSNGTLALELCVRGLGLCGEVIVPSFTFIATAHALLWQGIKPVFCDVDPRTHCIDPEQIEALITPRTSAILAVHLWGGAANVDALNQIAERHSLELIFDAAHALGCSIGSRPVGSFGRAEVFSLHATKFIHTFEGGAVTTNDDALAEKLRLMRNFGFVGTDAVGQLGTNAKLNEVSAAMGLTLLDKMTDITEHNQRNYEAYREHLANIPGLRVFSFEDQRSNYQYVVVEVDEIETGLRRDDLIAVLRADNVRARRYFYPGCHRMQPYCAMYPSDGERLPRTEEIAGRVVVFPTGLAVDKEMIERVCAVVRSAVDNAPTVRSYLAAQRAAAN